MFNKVSVIAGGNYTLLSLIIAMQSIADNKKQLLVPFETASLKIEHPAVPLAGRALRCNLRKEGYPLQSLTGS